jgi:chromosome segregation ATPase
MHERQSLQQQLAESQAELTRHASIARDLAAARQEIADLRSNRPSGEGSGSLVNVGQVSELEQERAALEAELELVRGRAAELYDTLSQERRAQSENRSETANELKQLRRIVEKQAELLSERVAVAAAPSQREVSVADVADTPIEAAAASDPVINSVMAQFAKLQKEVAERRKHRK